MSYTTTSTNTNTFTLEDAKYLASRIRHGLTYLRLHCGQITEQQVENFALEAAILLIYGRLDSVKYGYQKDGDWVYAISYSVNALGQIEAADDTPTIVDPPKDLNGAKWHSYLIKKDNSNLTPEMLANLEELLPIKRTAGVEPSSKNGSWSSDNFYSRNGIGMTRNQFRQY